jgi:hypothetical protein
MPRIDWKLLCALLALVPGAAGQAEPASAQTPPPGERYACAFEHNLFDAPECKPEAEFLADAQKHAGHAGHKMVIYEVTRYHGLEPTPEQRAAADALAEQTRAAVKAHGWFDFDKALADGYKLAVADKWHYVNDAFIFDDRVLDPERPEYLMFYDTAKGKRLAGVMFVAPGVSAEGPQIGGPLTRWHYHVWRDPFCLKDGRVTVGRPKHGVCSEGEPSTRSPEMLHVWFIEHPFGTFASQMGLPQALMERLIEQRGGG